MVKTPDLIKIEVARQRVIKHLNELTHSHNERLEQFSIETILNTIVAYEMTIQDLKEEYPLSPKRSIA